MLAADADGRDATDVSLGEGVSCDDEGCVAQMASGRLIALSLKPEGLADDCARAALMVTAGPVPPACGATAIDLKRLRAQGAMALRWTRRGFIVDAVRPRGTDRPWSPAAGGIEAESETVTGCALVRPGDATPPEPELQGEY